MKRSTCFLAAILLGFLLALGSGVPAALAGGITYDDANYMGSAGALWDTIAGSGDGGGTDGSDTTPFDVSVSVQFPRFAVVAQSSIPDNANLYSSAEARASEGDVFAGCGTAVEATFFFTATTPVIRLTFDYGLGVEVEGFSNDAIADAYATLWLELWDHTEGGYLFDDGTHLEVGISEIQTESDSETGIFDELFYVVVDNEYRLNLSLREVVAEVKDDATAYAWAEITNIQVDAVPIPSSLLLLGSGVLGLVGLRKKLKK